MTSALDSASVPVSLEDMAKYVAAQLGVGSLDVEQSVFTHGALRIVYETPRVWERQDTFINGVSTGGYRYLQPNLTLFSEERRIAFNEAPASVRSIISEFYTLALRTPTVIDRELMPEIVSQAEIDAVLSGRR